MKMIERIKEKPIVTYVEKPPELLMQDANRYMKQKVIKINVDLGLGKFSKTVFGNDLTYEYIQINADYRN